MGAWITRLRLRLLALLCKNRRSDLHEELRLHLEQVRYQGYAVDDEEFTAGVRCLAVPVFDHTGHGIATMGISGPSVRMTMDLIPEFAEIVMGAAAGLSKRLGFHAVSEESG